MGIRSQSGTVRTLVMAALLLVAAVAPGSSSTFVAWRISGIAAGDLLNVRAYPSPRSRILVGYPNGTVLSMTGRCTGGVDLDRIAGLSKWRQRKLVRYRWCQVWLDPTGSGDYRPGWVYGRYISPL